MGELSKQPNIGQVVEGQLFAIGITTLEQLKEIGSKQAWLKIRSIDSSACINRLLGLEGAIRGVRKTQLSEEIKAELREFYQSVKGNKD